MYFWNTVCYINGLRYISPGKTPVGLEIDGCAGVEGGGILCCGGGGILFWGTYVIVGAGVIKTWGGMNGIIGNGGYHFFFKYTRN